MREINAVTITETVKKLCIQSNCHLTGDVKNRIKQFYLNAEVLVFYKACEERKTAAY